jgi:ABC-2 type transport system permease protein
VWWAVLGRADVESGAPSGGAARVRSGAGAAAGGDGGRDTSLPAGVFAGVLGRLPRTTVGAVAARELRYLVRHPRQRVAFASLVVVAVVIPLVNVSRGHPPKELTLLGSSAALLGGLSSLNQIGIEGRSLWIHLLSGISPRTYLRGKNLALVTYLVPLVALTTTVLAAVTGGWQYLPAALLAGTGSLLAGIGVGNVNSVVAPMPQPEGSNPFATGVGGQGCVSGLLMLVSMAVITLVMLPVGVALLLLRHHPAACVVVGLIAVVYGIVVWSIGSRLAAARMVGREAELQRAVTPAG